MSIYYREGFYVLLNYFHSIFFVVLLCGSCLPPCLYPNKHLPAGFSKHYGQMIRLLLMLPKNSFCKHDNGLLPHKMSTTYGHSFFLLTGVFSSCRYVLVFFSVVFAIIKSFFLSLLSRDQKAWNISFRFLSFIFIVHLKVHLEQSTGFKHLS